MSLSRIALMGAAGEIEMILGAAYLIVALLGLFFVWHFQHIARLERKQEQQQTRRELSRRYNLRSTEPG